MSGTRLGLFEGFGVEIEYMIVDRQTLDVAPICDRLIELAAGEPTTEIERGELAWSNELVLHVVELKTSGPVAGLDGVADAFSRQLAEVDQLLAGLGARTMPTAMHPWMNPQLETRLWPHENGPIYQAFDRIFGCQGHGWSNLQSTHLNLPFATDDEFARLHDGIRFLLPLLPALAASSPIVEGRLTATADNRMAFYRTNARRVPSVTGRVVPEAVAGQADYEARILGRIYDDLAPLDPKGTLRHEWANARGAIARFDRGAIEIRVLDTQEHPRADLAILALVIAVLRDLIGERWVDRTALRTWSTDRLADLLDRTIVGGDRTPIDDPVYLAALGHEDPGPTTAGDLWRELAGRLELGSHRPSIEVLLEKGCLARRIAGAVGPEPDRATLADVYLELCDCLASDRPFRA